MTFNRVRGAGLWLSDTVILQAELEQLDENLSLAIDSRGGAYAPSSPLDIGGAGLHVLTPTDATQVTPKGYVDGLVNPVAAALPRCAKYFFGASALANGAGLELNSFQFADTGYQIVGDSAEVPTPGKYQVNVFGEVTCTSTASRPRLGVVVGYGGGNEFIAAEYRDTSSADAPVRIHGGDVILITDPAAQRITVTAHCPTGGGVTLSTVNLSGGAGNVAVSVARLRED